MLFAGLPFATLVTIAAVAGGLTTLFYILKLRRRPVAVPYSRIWERILRDKEATSWWSRLKRLLSLLLQLALLALLILALGDPRIAGLCLLNPCRHSTREAPQNSFVPDCNSWRN